MIHAILGVLFEGNVYANSMKNHIQLSLPIFMDNRLKGIDKNGNRYDYGEFPPEDVTKVGTFLSSGNSSAT